MFNKWVTSGENIKTDGNGNKDNNEKGLIEDIGEERSAQSMVPEISKSEVNTILKGSKLKGDINVTCDLELSGDVEGNIKSLQDSHIVIKGTCKGNIETTGGSVDIEGELKSGDITAGSNVKITGKFNGGEIKAKGRIYVDGQFSGKLEGNEVEIGSNAQGKGEIHYKENISISKGAKVEVHISRIPEELKAMKNSDGIKVVDIKPPAKEKVEAK
jgi:cytoskeletal protein CcmA (bactofilin family)